MSGVDPMEYLAQAKAAAAAATAAANMSSQQSHIAEGLRARMCQIDQLAGSCVSDSARLSCLSAEDRRRFGLDSSGPAERSSGSRSHGQELSRSGAQAQRMPARQLEPMRDPRASGRQQQSRRSSGGPALDPATADLIRKLEACGEHQNAAKLRASFGC